MCQICETLKAGQVLKWAERSTMAEDNLCYDIEEGTTWCREGEEGFF